MTRRVFILGAGASAPSGVPVVKHFFNAIEDSKHWDTEHFQRFMKGVRSLRRVYAKGQLDTQNIEEVLGAFELASLSDLRLVEGVEPGDLVVDAKRVIGDVIAERAGISSTTRVSSEIRHTYQIGELHPPPGYSVLASHVRGTATFITFNQDLLLEYALFAEKRGVWYPGIETIDRGAPVIKLHGSLNWKRQESGAITPIEDPLHFFEDAERAWLSKRGDPEELGTRCFFPTPQDPFIVPPSWAKYSYYEPLRGVWKAAVEALQQAQEICVIGYSLPPSDYFFRHLFAIGTISDARIRRFAVFDPAVAETRVRYEELLGAELSGVFDPHSRSFESLEPQDIEPTRF